MTHAAHDEGPSVEDALRALHEAGSFTDADLNIGVRLATRVKQGSPLTGKQRRLAYRMLRKYADALAEQGIDYAAVPDPAEARGSAAPTARPDRYRARVGVDNGRVWLQAHYDLKERCKEVPSYRWNPKGKVWTYPETPAVALAIKEAFSDVTLEADDAFTALLARGNEQRAAAIYRDADDLPQPPGLSTTAWRHQRQAYWFAAAQESFTLRMGMGSGKSLVVVATVLSGDMDRVLILCPSSVVDVWPREFRRHGERPAHVVAPKGSIASRVEAFDHAFHECRCGQPHVIVANYEATAHEPFTGWSLEQDYDLVVLDESHRLKAPNGVWSRHCARLRDRAQRRAALTGTLMPQGPLDVFAQYRALDPGIFGRSYHSFRAKYAVMGGYGNYEVVAYRIYPTYTNRRTGAVRENPNYSPDIEEDFRSRLESISYQVDSSVLELPEANDVTRGVMLSAKARALYDALENELYVDLRALAAKGKAPEAVDPGDVSEDEEGEGGEVTAANVLVKLLRLQQITGGAVKTDDGSTEQVDTAKEKALADYLTDLPQDEPVVVFCRFHHDLDAVRRVAESLDRRHGEVSGRRNDLNEDAMMPDDVDVMGVQIQSGGLGIDLTRAAYAVYYSLTFSLGEYDQSRARLVRPGQERSVLFTHLVAQGTVDERIYDALTARREVVEYLTSRMEDAVE